MQPASINCYLAIIRVFYHYVRYEERIQLLNPGKTNRRLRVPRPLPRCLREQEVEKLFRVTKKKA
jgi:site-specific recombinase XerD